MNAGKGPGLRAVLAAGLMPVGFVALIACKDDPPPTPKASAPSASVEAPSARASDLQKPADAGRSDAGIPTVEDFEKEAEELISSDNLESELDKLEAEIQGS